MAKSEAEIFHILQHETDWEPLILEMTAFGIWLTQNNAYWCGGDLPTGKQVKDLVFDVVLKTLNRQRKWDPAKGELKPWLMDQVRSEVSNLFDKAASQREIKLEGDDREIYEGIEQEAVNSGVFGCVSGNPETTVIDREEGEAERKRRDALIDALYKAIEGDQELEDIYYAILDGCERKPRILAAELDAPVSQINNALKRFDRRVRAVNEQLGGKNG